MASVDKMKALVKPSDKIGLALVHDIKIPECGPGLEYMLDAFPFTDALRMILSGSGECAEVQWTFLSFSIAEWSIVCFSALIMPAVINGSRKRRIASGSGTQIQDVNRLLKQFKQMQKMMKKLSGKGGMKKMMRGLGGGMGGGGMPPGGMPPGGGMPF